MGNSTIYRKDYQLPKFSVQKVALDFALYDDHALVTNYMNLKREHPGALELYGDELELISIWLNEKEIPASAYHLENGNLIIPEVPDLFELKIITHIRPQDNTKLSGLYRSQKMFCTQCEAEGFRRMTFYLDRPDVLSIFTTKISAQKSQYPVLLSNGNLIETGDSGDGRHWAVWQDPFKKPSYLFALVAGDLACVKDEFITCTGRKIDLRLYVEPGNEDKCSHALESLKASMRWDEKAFGREYDLDIFMIVAVSDFNMGAMENKGLNIFNSKYILARPDTATDVDYADIEGVVGHEYFHNWSGNRVTCRDWFQLSLKEGLTVFRDQEFSADMNSRDVNRIWDVKALRSTQFPEDAGAMAHPVRPDSYEEINNFYTATIYNKGAEVIRMQQTLLGKEGFRKGMDLYFERHDGQAVTIDDFVKAMEDANQVDFTQFKLWYSQAGTPEVQVKSQYEKGTLTIQLTQSCPPTPDNQHKKPFHIPIKMALFDAQGQEIPVENFLLELKDFTQTFQFSNLKESPVISLLREFSAPIILHHQSSLKDHLFLLQHETDGFAKWESAQKLTLECIKTWYNSPRSDWKLSEELTLAYEHVLKDETLDPALRAEILTPPGFEEAASAIKQVDVTLLEAARDFFRAELGKKLFKQAKELYQQLWQTEDHDMNSTAYGRRQLRNICLWLMMKGEESNALGLCQQQFAQAKTMTDQMASFALLVNSSNTSARKTAVDGFYQQWAKEDLVMDKWLALQASCELPATLHSVEALLSHPVFNLKNPNKVRSLIGAFCQANPRHFHAPDGSGYAFLTEMLLKLDKINPQITARLATPFTRWNRVDEPRQLLIKQQLKRLSQEKLSRDLNELVHKSLS